MSAKRGISTVVSLPPVPASFHPSNYLHNSSTSPSSTPSYSTSSYSTSSSSTSSNFIISSSPPPRSSHLSEQTSNALFAMPRRNWRHCAATSNRRNAKDADNNNTLTPQTRKSSRSSTTNISGRRASGRRSFIRNAIYCFC